MMGFGMVGGMLFFWVILIVLAVLMVRGLFQNNRTNTTNESPSARQVLEQRYARGEIDQQQFKLMLKDLQ
jgi:putative membrane protein